MKARTQTKGRMDKWLLWTTILLVAYGFLVFFSAALGELAREGQAVFSRLIFTQAFFGVVGGFSLLFLTSKIPYTFWKKYSLHLFVFALVLTMLVFVPGLGAEYGGAVRWLDLGPFSFQPSELLKVAFVMYFATIATNSKKSIRTLKHGVLPLGIILAISGFVLLAQPDTDSLIVMTAAAIAIFIVAGAKWKHFFMIVGSFIAFAAFLVLTVPYIQNRVEIFFNPGIDSQGVGYQIEQSLIAVGSGEFFGRGFGQSVQKFSYLPEPIGDSVFAVLAEELGFLGGVTLIGMFGFLALRGFLIASRARDIFGRLLAVGIVILITTQAFLNIASMLALFPLAGLPLPFVSHGGTALLISLGTMGVLLNISRTTKKKVAET